MSKWGRFWIYTAAILLLIIYWYLLPERSWWILTNRPLLVIHRIGLLFAGVVFSGTIYWVFVEFIPHNIFNWWPAMREQGITFFQRLFPNRIMGFILLLVFCFLCSVWFPPDLGPRRITGKARAKMITQLSEHDNIVVEIRAVNTSMEVYDLAENIKRLLIEADWKPTDGSVDYQSYNLRGSDAVPLRGILISLHNPEQMTFVAVDSSAHLPYTDLYFCFLEMQMQVRLDLLPSVPKGEIRIDVMEAKD